MRPRSLLEMHRLAEQTLAALNELLRGKGMKAHIGAYVESSPMRTVRGTVDTVNDLVERNSLVHGAGRMAPSSSSG